MSPTFLLDANALIALAISDHEHHAVAASWAAEAERLALCPVVEGALVRFVLRMGHDGAAAKALLDGFYASPSCEFWPDDLSYRHAELGRVVGHRQVTDAFLVALAAAKGGRLATFDPALAQVDATTVLLIQ